MTIHKSVSELIGKTPLVELTNYEKNHNLEATIVGKVELFNPAGSVHGTGRLARAVQGHQRVSGRHHAAEHHRRALSGGGGQLFDLTQGAGFRACAFCLRE